MLKQPTPKAFSDTDAETSMTKYKGEKRSRASKPKWPSRAKALKPKNSSACAPNCTVLVVTAK